MAITGADIPATLKALTDAGVEVRQVDQQDELTVFCQIAGKEYEKTERILGKRGDFWKVLGREGLWYLIMRMVSRPALLLGLGLLTAATLVLPSRVFFVRVEGNVSVPARQILEAAEQCGIGFGTRRDAVRSEKVKNELLERIPQLQWAGVNTRGCVAVITVRERIPSQAVPIPSEFGHVVAARDGIIISCTATAGSLKCMPGQAVTEGQLLISGYTDCGISIRAEQAQGEVYAQTERNFRAIIPDTVAVKQKKTEVCRKITLIFGKKRIILWKDSGIWDTTCDRMYEEYYVTLPGGFQLPLALTVDTYAACDAVPQPVPEERARKKLEEFGDVYLHGQMVAGSILDSELEYTRAGGCICLTGQYRCIEMIGKMQRLKIGEYNGKSD